MHFEYDPQKNIANIGKHGVDFEDALRIFENQIVEKVDNRQDYGETRYIVIGLILPDTLLTVVYTWRGAKRRIISARLANKAERTIYDQENHPNQLGTPSPDDRRRH